MGIKHLNQFVKRECPGAIKPISFADLAGKVIVVDASIYMYQFLANQALLENMYTLITVFQLRGIVPVPVLLVSEPATLITDLMREEVVTFNPTDDAKSAVGVFERYDLVSAPVSPSMP